MRVNILWPALLCAIALTGCTSEETRRYEEIKSEYYTILSSVGEYQSLTMDADYLKHQIRDFILDFRDSRYRMEVENFEISLEEKIYDRAVKYFYGLVEDLDTKEFASYESFKQEVGRVKTKGGQILEDHPDGKSTYELKNAVHKLVAKEERILREQFAYEDLMRSYQDSYTFYEADVEIRQISSFLDTYAQSIMTPTLKRRIEEMEYLKFKLESNTGVSSIQELNRLTQKLEQYRSRVSDRFLAEVDSRIAEVEDSRSNVFREEYFDQLERLISQMDKNARDKASDIHTCGFLARDGMAQIDKSEDYSEIGNRKEFNYLYSYKMKGGFWCDREFMTTIRVLGILKGNETDGVQYQVVRSEKIGDYRL